MTRREFLKMLGMGLGAATLGGVGGEAAARPGVLHRRALGNTGRALSVIGLGGIVVMQAEQEEANEIVAWAVGKGVNYFDVAPTYGDAQDRLGPALQPYRDRAFLACKTGKRDAAGAREELEHSLEMMRTDHFDLYQLHGLRTIEETEQALGPGGALETFRKARDEGKVHLIGFSAHSTEAAELAFSRFDFDTVLFPFNAVCAENGNFGPRVLELAHEKGASCLALKTLAWQPWPEGVERKYPKCWYQPQDDPEIARLLVRYTLGLGVVAAVPPGDARLFRLAVESALNYEPLSGRELSGLKERIKGVEPIFKAE